MTSEVDRSFSDSASRTLNASSLAPARAYICANSNASGIFFAKPACSSFRRSTIAPSRSPALRRIRARSYKAPRSFGSFSKARLRLATAAALSPAMSSINARFRQVAEFAVGCDVADWTSLRASVMSPSRARISARTVSANSSFGSSSMARRKIGSAFTGSLP